jgi:hypothetical protein
MILSLFFASFLVLTPVVLGDDLHKVQDILNQIVGHYYTAGDQQDGLGPIDNQLQQEDENIIIPSTVVHEEEHLPFNPLWGHHFLSGGAGEGDQFLSPEGSVHNVHQVKSDSMLPAYCDPPNPCPEG